MDLRWQLIASLLRRGSQSINLGQWLVPIVGQIGEKMFTSGRKCNFFHKIAQYDANAGNPDRQQFCPPVLFFCYL